MLKAPIKNLYEVLFILRPNLSDDELDNAISQVESAIKNYGGSIVRTDDPLQRRFTHKIKGFKDGYYISIVFNSPPDLPNTLKRTLSIADDVLRYTLIRKEN